MRKKAKTDFQEGDWFLVSLKPNYFSLGVITRIEKSRTFILAYFYKPFAMTGGERMSEEFFEQKPEDAVGIYKVGTEYLRDEIWPIVHTSSNWDRNIWAITVFKYSSDVLKKYQKRYYSSEGPFGSWLRIEKSSPEEIADLPKDGSHSPEAMIYELEKILNNNAPKPIIIDTSLMDKNITSTLVQSESSERNLDAILVYLKLDDGVSEHSNDAAEVLNVGDKFHHLFSQRIDIDYDGDSLGDGFATLYFYGDDADKMFDEIFAKLNTISIPKGSYFIKQYALGNKKEERYPLCNLKN